MLHLQKIEDIFKNHQIHKTLENIKNSILGSKPSNFDQLGDEEKFAFIRLQHIHSSLVKILENTDKLLASEQLLNEVNNDLSQILNHASQYLNNPNAHYGNLNTGIFNLSKKLNQLFLPKGIEGLTEAIKIFTGEMAAEKEKFIKTSQEIRTKANESVSQFNQTEQKLNDLKTEIDNQKTRLDKMLNEQTTTFNNAETTRNQNFTKAQQQQKTDFENLIKEFSTKKSEIITEHTSALKTLAEESSNSSESLLGKIQAQLNKAEEIVGTLVKTSLSGTYKQIANRELWSAWVMRCLALLFFGGMVAMIVWLAYDLSENKISDWRYFAARLSFSIALFVPAVYLAKESSRHWIAEKNNRKLALELATFEPFLVHLDDKERKALIAKKADEYFGNKNSDFNDDNLGIKDMHLKVDQFLKIAERISKIVHPSGTK